MTGADDPTPLRITNEENFLAAAGALSGEPHPHYSRTLSAQEYKALCASFGHEPPQRGLVGEAPQRFLYLVDEGALPIIRAAFPKVAVSDDVTIYHDGSHGAKLLIDRALAQTGIEGNAR